MNDFILEEMNKYDADGVDFVSIMFDPIMCPNIYKTYTREEWLASDGSYPKTNRRYWKIIDGKKTYVDTVSFKVLEGIVKDAAAAPDMEEVQDVSEDT
jgi:hypothetical protein